MRTFLASLRAICGKLAIGFPTGRVPAESDRKDRLRNRDDSNYDPRFGGDVPIVGVL